MLPKWHILFSLIFSVVLFALGVPLFSILIFFFSAVFIDIDHYFFYVQRKKDLSLKNSMKWNYALPRIHKPIAHIFHSVEFFIIILVLSFFFPVFFFVFFGVLFHLIIDLVDMAVSNKWGVREFFFLRYFFSKNKKKYM